MLLFVVNSNVYTGTKLRSCVCFMHKNLCHLHLGNESVFFLDEKDSIGEHQSPKFKDIQKLIADKLELSRVKKEGASEINFAKASILSETRSTGRKSPPNSYLQPPPPPPPITSVGRNSAPTTCLQPPPPPPPPPIPSRPSARLSNTQKAPAVVELFHSLKNKDGKIDSKGPVNHPRPVVISAHSSIVGEIQNRSAHLLAVSFAFNVFFNFEMCTTL